MSAAKDLITLLEYTKAFKTKEKKVEEKKETDIVSIIQNERRRAKALDELFKEIEKLNKKEDKKPDPGMSAIHVAMFTILLSAMSGPFYFWMFGRMAGKW